jgi:hypothetical protein
VALDALMMGTEMVPETLQSLYRLTRLIRREGFINSDSLVFGLRQSSSTFRLLTMGKV